jgi:UDP-N-acetylmuramoylalanine--D-glutamate ligase
MTLIASDKRRVVVGLGATGLSCARHLAARGLPFAVVDTREAPPGLDTLRRELPQVPVQLGGFDAALLADAEELIVSPGVPLQEPAIAAAIAAGVSVIGDIDLFARALKEPAYAAPLIAITGSNGKSTVTTLVGEFAKAAGRNVGVGGNLGTPALELLAPGRDLYVLELSSFQLERAQPLDPLVATVLNVSADHMDRYPNLLAYHQAKHRIFRGAKHVVVNRDDNLSQPLLAQGMTQWSFGLNAPDFRGFGLRTEGGVVQLAFERELLLPVTEMKIAGRHNIANALAALAIGHAAGLPLAAMVDVLKTFTGLAHRCQLVGEARGVRFYDDSKGTNVGATIAAVEGLCDGTEKRVVLIAGGVGKGADFAALRPVLQRCGRAVVLIGESAPKLEAALAGALPLSRAASMREAVVSAALAAQPGDAVLLSPACASFDMFRDYAHRGDVFAEAVRELLGAGEPAQGGGAC